jgi:DNA repair protein RadC
MATHHTTLMMNPSPIVTTAGPMLRELTYRYQPTRTLDGTLLRLAGVMREPQFTAAALMSLIGDEAVEVFGILCLTTKLRVICWHEVSRGDLDSATVHPREVFKPALLVNAAAIIASHNHPSGDATPSPDDLALTGRLAAAGTLLGIELLDHLVIGAGTYVSLQQTGRL